MISICEIKQINFTLVSTKKYDRCSLGKVNLEIIRLVNLEIVFMVFHF